MTISLDDAERLLAAGFTQWEVEGFATAKDAKGQDQPLVNLDSPVWKAVIESRRDWRDDKIAKGWTPEEIENVIMEYYARDAERSPWDFLKAEYKALRKIDYIEALQRRKQRDIKATLGRY